MVIDVSELLNKKLSKKKVHLVYKEESFYDDGEKIEFSEPVIISGEANISGDVISLEASMSTKLNLPCSRCLTRFTHEVDIQIQEKFSNNPDNEDDEIIFIEGDTIDITDIVKNNIIMSLPIKKLCEDSCKGLCQHCGTNLNNSNCKCSDNDVDPRLAKLKDLFSAD